LSLFYYIVTLQEMNELCTQIANIKCIYKIYSKITNKVVWRTRQPLNLLIFKEAQSLNTIHKQQQISKLIKLSLMNNRFWVITKINLRLHTTKSLHMKTWPNQSNHELLNVHIKFISLAAQESRFFSLVEQRIKLY